MSRIGWTYKANKPSPTVGRGKIRRLRAKQDATLAAYDAEAKAKADAAASPAPEPVVYVPAPVDELDVGRQAKLALRRDKDRAARALKKQAA